jgi:hypothetical protein
VPSLGPKPQSSGQDSALQIEAVHSTAMLVSVSVGIVTCCGLDWTGQGSSPVRDKRFFWSPKRKDQVKAHRG